ncbi:Sirohydrochlorin ferrochelatase CfbA [Methanonatronarchaeum thermophilum]|uniref:Sirohydrochlorin cobaltochelatase n=1 Tax=Methanonatronarchaeum thermophilum TaxID=1927129 RepID=A0A1Y3GDG0_9EURY|nr:sirohydrochlorin nickelochelatase [Methanonatronarchaeum thermophilum]OUJ19491.1 Sirohydrochlorin ferrochelatase CfbA [Methanonatronarchaeum thermophilum]
MDSKIGVLVIGHGSRLDYNKQLIMDFAERLEGRFDVVKYSFLGMNEPKVPDALDELLGMGLDKIVAFPMFLAPGVHTTEDIPKALGIEGSHDVLEHEGGETEVYYSNPLGMSDEIVEIGVKRIEEALE